VKKLGIILNSVFLIFNSFCFSQNDSLWAVYQNKNEADTNRLKAIHAIAWSYIGNNPDTAIILAEQELQLAIKAKAKNYEGKALNIIGISFNNKGNYLKALDYYLKVLKVREEIKDKQGIGSCYGNIGLVYWYQSDYPKALEYHLKSLKIKEETGDKKGTGLCYSNIGNVYYSQSNYSKALDYYLKALTVREEIGDKQGVGNCYGNIAGVYQSQSKTQKALEYYLKALKISEEIGDNQGIGNCYGNLGNVYADQTNYPKALECFLKSLQLREEIGDKNGIGDCYINIGGLYNKLANYKQAIKYSDSALQLSKEIGNIDNARSAYQNLADVYAKTGRYKEAYNYHVKFKTLNDSLFSAENISNVANQESKMKEDQMAAGFKEEQIKKGAELKQQKIISFSFTIGFVLVLVLIFVVFRSLKQSREKNKIIENQKAVVELHQKEIIDSITYAKRLQQAILPAEAEIKKYLPENFLFYNPKDIVAGDFYWMHTTEKAVYIAAADCTGHGVPGAMVSVVCSNALNRAVKEFALTETGEILDKVRQLVIETFEKSDKDVKDGMDISLARIQKIKNSIEEKTEIQWSGANNSLWYIQNNALTEIKANKQPIGKYSNPVPFTTHTREFSSAVTFYLFSDGYADQFSTRDKKLMTKKFKEILLSIQHLALHEQGKYVEKYHIDWKGDMEQTDDVLVIGIKI